MWSESIEVFNPYEAVMAGIIHEAAEKQMMKDIKRAKRRERFNKLCFWRAK